ncbi:MAG TPA: L,D-transpeptidase family protein, partial [Saprospiraceae bacterium]|nr:L,D-transpeptidase family protein [Saprospiraceae bacterium]
MRVFGAGKRVSRFSYFLFGCAALAQLCACSGNPNGQSGERLLTQDSSLYTRVNFTSLLLDSTYVVSFLDLDPKSGPVREDVRTFYQRRDYQYAWFLEDGPSRAIGIFTNLIENYATTFLDSSLLVKDVQAFVDSMQLDTAYFERAKGQIPQIELALTTLYFNYARKAYHGLDKNPRDLEWYIPRKKKNFQLLIDKIHSPDLKPYEPVNSYYQVLKKQLIYHRKLLRTKEWNVLVMDSLPLKKADFSTALPAVKERLFDLGDFFTKDPSMEFTEELASALKQFQYRNGLVASGILNAATVMELNRPIEERIRQMTINMERLRWLPDSFPSEFLMVNIPNFQLLAFNEGRLLWSMPVVVGKSATSTSIFSGIMNDVVFSPYWNVPQSIILKELLPQIRKSPSYLEKQDMEVVSGNQVLNPYRIPWHQYRSSVPFTIRQRPGPKNALGRVKFLFPNSFSIYLHDTPYKTHFAESKRAFSHGCIR